MKVQIIRSYAAGTFVIEVDVDLAARLFGRKTSGKRRSITMGDKAIKMTLTPVAAADVEINARAAGCHSVTVPAVERPVIREEVR